jgi:hypothetical protein
MKSHHLVCIAALGAFVLLAGLMGSSAFAQATDYQTDYETKALLDRIKASKTEAAQEPAKDEVPKIRLSTPQEEKLKEKKKAEAAKKEKPQRPTKPVLESYQSGEYLRSLGIFPILNPDEVAGLYQPETVPGKVLKGGKEGAEAKRGAKPEDVTVRKASVRDYRNLAQEYDLQRKYAPYNQQLPGVVASGALPGEVRTPVGRAITPGNEMPAAVPDPAIDKEAYEKLMKGVFGEKGALPPSADPNLVKTYEVQRFQRWLQQDFEARVSAQSNVTVPQLFSTYNMFQNLPPTNRAQQYRDVYVPNSQDFINPSYRGTIYGQPFIDDPYRYNYNPNITQSKYSNADYFNMNTKQGFQDWYVRDMGVNNQFVPDGVNRNYDMNTIKQWTTSFRENFGVDLRVGAQTYGDYYRMWTSKPSK